MFLKDDYFLEFLYQGEDKMSVENLKIFQEKLLEDKELQAKVKEKEASLKEKPTSEKEIIDILIPIASSQNLPFSWEDYLTLKEEKANSLTLTEEELDSISGGNSAPAEGVVWGVCFLIGAGSGDNEGSGNCVGGPGGCDGAGLAMCIVVGLPAY